MTALSQQMQGAMNNILKTARIDTMINNAKGTMIDAANRIEKRPSLKGCNALEQTQSHNLIKANKDDSSFQMLQMAASGGGVAEVAMDVAVDSYANRKATQVRLQDEQELTPRQEAKIRQDNLNDMKLFFSVSEQLETLELLKDTCDNDHVSPTSEGYWNAIINPSQNEIIGVRFEETGPLQTHKPQMSAEQKQMMELKALAFGSGTNAPKPAYA